MKLWSEYWRGVRLVGAIFVFVAPLIAVAWVLVWLNPQGVWAFVSALLLILFGLPAVVVGFDFLSGVIDSVFTQEDT
jgi:hypothetical protein